MSNGYTAADKALTPSSGDDPLTDARTARIARNTDGNVLGAAVFLAADDLRALGVALDGDDETTDAGRVAYTVADGELRVAVADGEGGGR